MLARTVSSVSHRADMSRSSSSSARQGAGAADRPDRAWRSWQVSRQPHDFWVTLVKAAKKEAQAKAALLASVQAQQDEMILEASTRATIDALVGEGFSASRTLRDHVKRWADMIHAEYAGETRCDKAQLAKALAERLSATPDLNAEQQREDRVRKAIIGSLQPEGAADISRAQPRSRHSVLVSPDQKHDPAFVQHCNDKIITPLMRQLGVDGDETFTIHHVDSDGCPHQFALAAQ